MSSSPGYEIILTPQGFKRRYISEELIPQADDAIAKALSTAAVQIDRIATGHLGGVIHGRVEGRSIILAQHIPSLLLTTHYKPRAGSDPCLTPEFGQKDETISLTKPEWKPPASARLWFITHATMRSSVTCYLVFTRSDKPGIWKLPLPNTYDDGKLCMGDAFEEALHGLRSAPNDTELGLHAAALEHFRNTAWNGDLWRNRDATDALFRFNFEGKQLPVPDRWADWCSGVSSTIYNWLGSAGVFKQ